MNETVPVARPAKALPAHTAHLVAGLPLGRRTRVMDVGANPANRPAYADLVEAGAAEVHGFEPGEDAYLLLEESKGEYEFYHPHAVGAGADATFYALENGSFSSIYRPDMGQVAALGHWHKSLKIVEEIPMTTVALDGIEGLPRPDMLKMDTQGAELEILVGGADVLSESVVIMPEVRFYRLYENEPMLGRVDQHLRGMGFMLHKILPGASVRLTSSRIAKLRPGMTRNQMVDADAIYIRDIARHTEMSDAQLARLALLADAVFTSMDLVLRCLDLLAARGAISEDIIDDYIEKLPRNFRVPQE